MPIYEYRCRSCGRKNSFLVLSLENPPRRACRHCGGEDLEKLVSRIAVLRSEEDRLERMADSAEAAGLDENDPRSVARWMKKMGRGLGDEVGEDFDQALEEAVESGETGEGGGGMETGSSVEEGDDVPAGTPPEED